MLDKIKEAIDNIINHVEDYMVMGSLNSLRNLVKLRKERLTVRLRFISRI